jgi:hypothetical protein
VEIFVIVGPKLACKAMATVGHQDPISGRAFFNRGDKNYLRIQVREVMLDAPDRQLSPAHAGRVAVEPLLGHRMLLSANDLNGMFDKLRWPRERQIRLFDLAT